MLKLKLPQSSTVYQLDRISHEKGDGDVSYFLLRSTEDENINITVFYNLTLYNNYDPDDFECYPFLSPVYYKEENIFEVKVNDKKIGRIGWMFPIQSLSSTAHSQSANEHYLKYAFVAFHKLLLGDYFVNDYILEASDPSAELEITEIYNSELIVLCTSKEKTHKIYNFEIFDYIPFLYSARYFYCSGPQELGSLEKDSASELITGLTIKAISPSLKEEIFVKSLFKDLLKESNHPLVQFHLLYQIVELLINKVYDSEIENIVLSAKSRDKKPHDILKEINTLQTEKHRVIKLVDSYLSAPPTSSAELIELSRQISKFKPIKNAEDENKQSKSHVGHSFYIIRNMVVHDFRMISEKDIDYAIFKQFVNVFEKFIIELIINFKDERTEYDLYSLEWLKYLLQNESKI